MTRKAGVEIVGDERDVVRAFRHAGQAAGSYRGDLRELSVQANKTADAQIRAAVRKDARLREEIRAYRAAASAAKRGSREQVTAANLAASAEGRLARSLGVTARESRHLATSAGKAERELGRVARGGIAGSGALRSMGRSLAFASAGFLGAAGVVSGIKSTITAASDLVEQVSKAGVVFRGTGGEARRWSSTLKDSFGLTREEAIGTASTFGNLLVPMGLTRRAALRLSESLTELGGDVASFNNADPTAVLEALRSGLTGQVRPLRQFGVFLTQDRIAAEALADGIAKSNVSLAKVREANDSLAVARARVTAANAKYGAGSVQAIGAARALSAAERGLAAAIGGTPPKLTAAQKALATYRIILRDTADAHGDAARTANTLEGQLRREHAIVGDLRESIGLKLTPIVIRYLTRLNDWLGKSRNQQKITRAVATVVQDLETAVADLTPVVKTAAHVAEGFSSAVGGSKNAVKLLALAFVSVKTAKLLGGLTSIKTEAKLGAGEVGLLRSNLLALSKLGVIGVTLYVVPKIANSRLGKKLGLDYSATDLVHDIGKALGIGGGGSQSANNALLKKLSRLPTGFPAGFSPTGGPSSGFTSADARRDGTTGAVTGPTRRSVKPLTSAQALTVALAASPDRLDLLKRQSANLATAIAELRRRRDAGKVSNADFVAQVTGLLDDQRQVDSQIATIEQAAATKAANARKRTAAAAARAARKRAADARRAARAAAKAYLETIGSEAQELKNAVARARARISAGAAPRIVGLAGQGRADDALVAFYEKEAHDSKLTRKQRARYAGLAIGERRREQREASTQASALRKARDRIQFRAVGLGPTGGELDPSVKALRAEASHVQTAIKGTFLDVGSNRKLMQGIRRVLSGELGTLSVEMRSHVKSLLDNLKGQLTEFDGFNLTAADKRRRFLDRQYADRYRRSVAASSSATAAGVVSAAGGSNKVVHFSPQMHVVQDEPVRRALDRAYFRMRVHTIGATPR